jgi:hypothetical protein
MPLKFPFSQIRFRLLGKAFAGSDNEKFWVTICNSWEAPLLLLPAIMGPRSRTVFLGANEAGRYFLNTEPQLFGLSGKSPQK